MDASRHLPPVFVRGVYRYTQLQRCGGWAIYSQAPMASPLTSLITYEVVDLGPEGAPETYPPAQAFGTTRWWRFTLAEAEALYAEMLQGMPDSRAHTRRNDDVQ
jgi:hypothetical protein